MSLEPRKYSERLGVIDADQLQAVADRFDLGAVTDAEAAPAGLFGQILFITTTSGEFAMRGNPHGHVQLTKERVVAKLIHDRSSLPAPWPYQVSDDTDLFGWTYAVMPRLAGACGSDLWDAADDDGRIELSSAAGEALARLHETTSASFGPYDAQMDAFVEMDDFADWALHRLEHWRSLCRSINALSTEAERYIDNLIEECAEALDEPFDPVLVHHDFKFGNVNFEPAGRGFVPTGIFDLAESYFADHEEDIVRMLWTVKNDDQRNAFADAYVAHLPLRSGASDRLALYALSDWLVIWEYGKRHGTWFEDVAFMDSVQPIVRNARAIGSRYE